MNRSGISPRAAAGDDVALPWDIRVAPGERGAGIAPAPVRAAGDGPVTTASGGWLTIETQNVNGPASLLPEDGLHTGRHRPVRLPGSPDEV